MASRVPVMARKSTVRLKAHELIKVKLYGIEREDRP
jgi:RNA-binding protein YhbY